MQHIDTIALQGSIDDMRLRIATDHSAMHKVRLGVARWRNGMPAPGTPAPSSPQSHWHAQAQCHFMCWLEGGGFAQAETQESAVAAPTETSQPAAPQDGHGAVELPAARRQCAV